MPDTQTLAGSDQDIKDLRKTQIRLLDALDNLCRKHGLVYWIDFGTLLGAVRYKDFIPWDDDIDVSMPMKDYKRFLEIAEKELPHDIFLQTPETDKNYNQCFTKLRDCYSTFLEHSESDDDLYHHGIFIDIFPSYYYPNIPYLLRKALLYVTVRSRGKAVFMRKNAMWNYSIYLLCMFVWFMLKPLTGNKVGQTPPDNGYYYAIPDTYIYPLKDTEFAGRFYPAPHNTHEYLSLLYGKTYMTPPPEGNRVPHAKLIAPHKPCKHPRAMQKKYGSQE